MQNERSRFILRQRANRVNHRNVGHVIICHIFFFFKDTTTTEIYTRPYTLSLHDALPISNHSRQAATSFVASRPAPKMIRCVGRIVRPGSAADTMNESTRSALGRSRVYATAVS